MGPRVLIIKLGALGDVVRTAALLPALRRLTTDDPHVTWVTSAPAMDLVRRMPGVHRVLPFDFETALRLQVERFDWLISLDKEPGPCSLAMTVRAENRRGVGQSRYGTPFPLSDDADYYFELGLNNDEKFRGNTRSYQDLMFEALGLTYEGERYQLDLTDHDRRAAAERLESIGAADPESPLIGLNPGAGGVFANKNWPAGRYVELIAHVAAQRPEVRFLLLGGPPEAHVLETIRRGAAGITGATVHHAGTDNPLGPFTALIDRCDLLVAGDTLAMHLAVARRRRVVALFGPTCEQEIDLFERGEKILTTLECAPCYLRHCDKSPNCQDAIPADRVARAALEQLALESETLIKSAG